jgi:hypothetical protein
MPRLSSYVIPHLLVMLAVLATKTTCAFAQESPGSVRNPSLFVPSATIKATTADPDDGSNRFKACPGHSLTFSVSFSSPIAGTGTVQLFHLEPPTPTSGTEMPQPTTESPMSTMIATQEAVSPALVLADSQSGTIRKGNVTITFPPDGTSAKHRPLPPKSTGTTILETSIFQSLRETPFPHLGCGAGGKGCAVIVQVPINLATKEGRISESADFTYLWAYSIYPPGKEGEHPGPCKP